MDMCVSLSRFRR